MLISIDLIGCCRSCDRKYPKSFIYIPLLYYLYPCTSCWGDLCLLWGSIRCSWVDVPYLCAAPGPWGCWLECRQAAQGWPAGLMTSWHVTVDSPSLYYCCYTKSKGKANVIWKTVHFVNLLVAKEVFLSPACILVGDHVFAYVRTST